MSRILRGIPRNVQPDGALRVASCAEIWTVRACRPYSADMSITQLGGSLDLDAVVAEHANTLLHRSRMSGRQLALILGLSSSTMAAKLRGGTWTFTEVARTADYFGVTMEEMATGLPSITEWQARSPYAIRDSNPEPAVWGDSRPDLRVFQGGRAVTLRLTANRTPRHLWAVGA